MTDSVNTAEIAVLCESDRLPHLIVKELFENQIEFNYLEKEYGHVARDVMEYDGVDCFYIDRDIEKFLACVHKRLNNERN